jgi:pyruvate/2-oxoglutarate dehydrogenase complex dihydrolipoamide acyltransferase (E2) component
MPVKNFTSRGTAVARIWKAIQTLGEAEAPQSADAAPEAAPAKKKASRATKAPKPATKAAKAAGSGPRESSKTAQLIEMLKRAGGATLDDICTKFGWQSHTTRALMSAGGSLAKKHGLTVVSTKGENGERTYSLAS